MTNHRMLNPGIRTSVLPLVVFAFALISMLSSSGCSLLMPKAEDFRPPLLSPAAAGFKAQVTQQVSQADDASRAMIASWSVDQEQMVLVGLAATGQELMRAIYDGEQLQTRVSPLVPAQIDVQAILSQIQLAYWPLAAIQQQLQGSGWSLQAVTGERRLYYDSHLVYRLIGAAGAADSTVADQAGAELVIEIPDLGQQVRITTLNMEML
ncbi:DUF3261 domain-containing protein [Oceanobacter mangrovi]|uniref:DUF3261 domain-containing protein n=1 Tax=Oceanobacter mangrovi TaxID=2862510 RepID=UPI001C8D2C82|nr:DUF3261 domain-containing protein [Oceanobacter mangrovi]